MEQGYTIGAIARMTGIPTQTLRSWERRYGVTEPRRSNGGRRIYSSDQLEKLRTIKQLLRHGEAIGQLANLELADLKARLEVHGMPGEAPQPAAQKLTVNVCGVTLGAAMRNVKLPESMALGECLESLPDCRALPGMLLVEIGALQPAQLQELIRFRERAAASRFILVVGVASRSTAEQARANGFEILPQRVMLATPTLALETLLTADSSLRARPRRFSDRQLAEVLQATPELACECPHHVVGILKQLNAFESYSQGCIINNEDDAATHALLYRMTARARATFEDVLAYLMEQEGAEPRRAAS